MILQSARYLRDLFCVGIRTDLAIIQQLKRQKAI
jgi:hypothetical protein